MEELTRRGFLKRAAGGAVLASSIANKQVDKLIPLVIPPENITPGVWAYFATTCRECPGGCGMHLWHRDGRVTKAEGIPDHPINHGGLCARGQSALQGLYDPDRIKRVVYRKTPAQSAQTAWAMAIEEIGNRIKGTSGKVALMSNLQTGALADLMQAFVKAFGSDRLLFYEPFAYESLRAAHQDVFGVSAIPEYRLDVCTFIVSFAADFLETWINPVQFARQFADVHGYRDGKTGRMAYVGPRLSMTAANADDFLQLAPGGECRVAVEMLATIIDNGWARADIEPLKPVIQAFRQTVGPDLPPGVSAERIAGLARAFATAESSVALAGPVGCEGPTAYRTAAAAALLNYAAGRIGQSVDFARPHALGRTATRAEAQQFLEALSGDDVLIVHEANPVYSINGAAEHIQRAGLVVYLGTMPDETSELAHWVLPVDSPLESWGDYEPVAGVHALMQPTMARLYDTLGAGDVLLGLSQVAEQPLVPDGAPRPPVDFPEWLRGSWEALAQRIAPSRPFDELWHDALRAGGVWEEPPAAAVKLSSKVADLELFPPSASSLQPPASALWAWPSILLFDGRVANRGWLQEAPDPTAFVVWGSWVDVHPNHAAALSLDLGDVVEVRTEAGAIEAPIRITEDVVEGMVAIPFGQGHTALGRNAAGRGANAFRLLGGDGLPQVTLRRTGKQRESVRVNATQNQFGRGILQWVALTELAKMQPGDGEKLHLPLPEDYDVTTDIYPPREYKEHRWAMVIDLARCTGCGACAVACYAENNIPVRGESGLRKGREGAWLQVAPYRDPGDPRRLGFLPMLCQHCDAAPCEPVCPVFASVHNEEGLNAQVYNRCIGTRYCSNNCPYKVRRFNWLNVEWAEPLQLQLNPEVSVRSRGVMEKCTFCIQRIRQAEHRARREDSPVRDGEIQPACMQSCPARAIVFGDLLDPDARVTQLTRRDPRRYHVLDDLNTKSAVTYLRRIKRSQEEA